MTNYIEPVYDHFNIKDSDFVGKNYFDDHFLDKKR